MRPLALRGSAALAVVALCACSQLVDEPFQYGTVEVVAQRRSGEAVAGVDLILYSGVRQLGFGVTGPEGKVEFPFVPFGGVGVQATPPEGYRPLDWRTGYVRTFNMKEGEHRDVSYTYLKFGPGSVAVQAVDKEGIGVAGVPIILYAPEGVVDQSVTDSTGEHRFLDVPFGTYGVRAMPGRGYSLRLGGAVLDGLLVEDGVEERARFIVPRCLGTLRVRVTEEEEGGALAAVPVSLYEYDGVVADTVTDGSGETLFDDLPCGNYGVRTGPLLGYLPSDPPSGLRDGLRVQHESDLSASFLYAPCRGLIAGTVRDRGGRAVEGAGLILYNDQGILETALTDVSGSHEFGDLPCAPRYGLRVDPPVGYRVREGLTTSYWEGLYLGPGAEYRFTFTIEACRGSIEVRVVDEEGLPVANAELTLYTAEGVRQVVSTGTDGKHAFVGLPCRTDYAVRIAPPAGYRVEEGPGSSYVDGLSVDPDGERLVTFTLSPS